MDVGLYARVSKEEQAKDGESIDQQIADMRALCERRGWHEVGLFVDCENYCATQNPKKGKIVNPSGERADRPALLKLLEMLKAGKLDGVVCWRDDRLVRHPRVAVAMEDALDIADTRRKDVDKINIYDATGGQIDRFTLSIKATIWREENKRRAERIKMGKIATLQHGRWPGTYDRLGYDAVREEGKRGRRIVLNEQEAQTVSHIYNLYDGGLGVRDIRARLIASGAPQKGRPNRRHEWAPTSIYDVLRSADYTGKLTWHFPDDEDYTIDIPCIIEPEQYARVRARLVRNTTTSTRNAKWIYLLQGILYCGECNGKMSVDATHVCSRTLADGTYKRYPVDPPRHSYRCGLAMRFIRDRDHPIPYGFNGRSLDWEVWRYIVDMGIQRPEAIRMQVLNRQEELRNQGDRVDGDIAHARRKLAEVDRERAFYQRQAARSKITEQEFDTRMEETGDVRSYWMGELDRLKELRDDAAKVQGGLTYATELLTSLQARIPQMDQHPYELATLPKEQQASILKERQRIIRALVDKVVIWHNRHVELHGILDGSEGAQFELEGPLVWRAP